MATLPHRTRDPSALPLVIGIGGSGRRDDLAGLAVARELAARLGGLATVETDLSGGPGLIDRWSGRGLVILVDAVRTGSPPGTIVRIDLLGTERRSGPASATSSHGLDVGHAVALASAIGRLPSALLLYGIEAGAIGPGPDLTPEVGAAVEVAADRISAELRARAAEGRA